MKEKFQIRKTHKYKILHEFVIYAQGTSFTVLYGEHDCGKFIAIPFFGIFCQAEEPNNPTVNKWYIGGAARELRNYQDCWKVLDLAEDIALAIQECAQTVSA